MSAREYFERLRLDGDELEKREASLRQDREALALRGRSQTASRLPGRDPMSRVDRLVAMEESLERDKARHELEVAYARRILYGTSGRGGLAWLRGQADADCIHGYYIQRMTWQQVADEISGPVRRFSRQLCRARAMRALKAIDQVGVWRLVAR